jgi:hypothetical protein
LRVDAITVMLDKGTETLQQQSTILRSLVAGITSATNNPDSGSPP